MKNMILEVHKFRKKNNKIKTKKTNPVFEEYKLTTRIPKESQILFEKEENEFWLWVFLQEKKKSQLQMLVLQKRKQNFVESNA